MTAYITCTPKSLPKDLWIPAAKKATEVNPANHPKGPTLMRALSAGPGMVAERIAADTTKYWHGGQGVRLTVGFLDNPATDLRNRIIQHMNAWAHSANVQFTASNVDPQVRIARVPNDGYWSYVGTDILSIPKDQPTMNLEGFTMETPESEYHRVVRHETGHTLGFVHEHMRRELVNRIDPAKAIAFFGQTQGWSPEEVRAQVLTPLEDAELTGTAHSDQHSVMCYQIPGTITKDGKPIIGGIDIDKKDFAFAASLYPKHH